MHWDVVDPVEGFNVASLASSQFFPHDLRSSVDDLVDGSEVSAMVKRSIGDHVGVFDVEYPTKCFVLNCLELVETGDGCGVEGDTRVGEGGNNKGLDKDEFGFDG